MTITLDSKNDLFVNQIVLCDADDELTGCRPTLFLAYVDNVNPLFVISDDPVQNFVILLIFEQFSVCLNTSSLICFSQLMKHLVFELFVKFMICIA